MKYGIRVKDIMARGLVTIRPNANLISAASLMKKKRVGALVVVEKKKLLGIITDGDVIKKVVAQGKNPAKIKVSDIMSRNPVSVSLDDDLYKVSRLMNEKRIKRVLVMEEGNLVGYLSERDLLKIQPGILDVLWEKLRVLQPSFRLKYGRV